jgi:hypothetical protein
MAQAPSQRFGGAEGDYAQGIAQLAGQQVGDDTCKAGVLNLRLSARTSHHMQDAATARYWARRAKSRLDQFP